MTDDDLKRLFDEMRRYFDVSTEAVRGEIRTVAEAVANLDEKIDRQGDRLEEKIDRGFAETQAMIKFSHAELDRRVSRLEEAFADLRSRVDRLEGSTH